MENDISLKEFKTHCLKMFKQRKMIDGLNAALKDEKTVLEKMKKVTLEYLEKYELENFDTGQGKVIEVNKFTVSIADKPIFFNELKKRKIFDDMATINSRTLNAFYLEEMEMEIEKGNMDFHIKGLTEPKNFKTISMRGYK